MVLGILGLFSSLFRVKWTISGSLAPPKAMGSQLLKAEGT